MPKPSAGTHLVAKVRQRIGWLQKELETRTGINWRTIQEIERGSKKGLKLSRRNALRISAVTGVAVDCLLDGDDWPANREIINISGKTWSEKDAEAIEQRDKDWPGLGAIALRSRAEFYNQLLLDHFYLRCLLLATPAPFKALNSWREYREKAWAEFLKEYPMAKIDKEDMNWSRWLETIKQDIDLVLAHPFQRAPEAEREMFWALLFGGDQIKSGEKIFDTFLEDLKNPRQTRRRKKQRDTFWGLPTPRPFSEVKTKGT